MYTAESHSFVVLVWLLPALPLVTCKEHELLLLPTPLLPGFQEQQYWHAQKLRCGYLLCNLGLLVKHHEGNVKSELTWPPLF